MPVNTETVGQSQRNISAGGVRDFGRMYECGLGGILVEQIPFQIENAARVGGISETFQDLWSDQLDDRFFCAIATPRLDQ